MRSEFHAGRWLVRILVLIGIAFAADAISKLVDPTPPTAGLFRSLTDAAIDLFGPRGVAFKPALSSLGCFYLARSFWRRTSKIPTDRLWW